MSISGHLDSLKRKHSALEEKISYENSSPMPDQSVVTMLKREKLRLKEQIEQTQALDASDKQH